MNYRHAYHAGNFADVFKHFVLMTLIQNLQKKENPFVYIDTHAGRALYDLSSENSQKTLESEQGIQQLWNSKSSLPISLQSYINLITEFQPNKNNLTFYPGSPCFARALARPQDQLILNEWHPEEARLLKQQFKNDKQVHAHSQNAYQWLHGIIPPKPNRGLVFIDPPYEQNDEYEQLTQLISKALKHWHNGIYAIWYPLTKNQKLAPFYASLKKAGVSNMLNTQLSIYGADSPVGLNGSGVLIINPPWQLDKLLEEDLKILWEVLSPNRKGGVLLEPISEK